MRADILAGPRTLSGVHCRQEGDFHHHVEALALAILRSTEEGRIASWCIVQLFPVLQQHHWDAYARLADVPSPSRVVIAATVSRYRALIQYPADAQPMGELFQAF